MRIWISGGGTAGHVYPGLTVLAAAGDEAQDVVWLGTATGMEAAIVIGRGIAFRAVASGPVVGTSPLRRAANLARIALGSAQAWRWMGRDRPDAVLVTGGYVSVPVAVAARARRVPVAVYLPDVVPGRAVRVIAGIAHRVAVTHEASLAYLPAARTVVTGYPVRPAVREADTGVSRRSLGFPAHDPVVLVFGGSRGARRLNEAVIGAAAELLERTAIVHVTGRLDFDRVAAWRTTLPVTLAARYSVHPYLDDDEMAAALAAADLAVSRAGASILGEYPARGLPSVLVPLPIAGGHQAANAAVLADAGAAVIVPNAELTADRLRTVVSDLLDTPHRLAEMSRRARSLDRPDAARRVWAIVASMAARAAAPGGGSVS